MSKLKKVRRNEFINGEKKNVEIYEFTNNRQFNKDDAFLNSKVKKVFDFAFDMTFGGKGEHRGTRSGGDKSRYNGEKFANTFQGKLAEFAVQEQMEIKGIRFDEPDIDVYGLGEWDRYDFEYNDYKISIKSTKFFGQLLLLETKDWNKEGEYLPNKNRGDTDYLYDYFIMVRIKPSIESIMKEKRYFYKDRLIVDKRLTKNEVISSEKELLGGLFNIKDNPIDSIFEYEVAGVISNETLKHIIKNKYIIPKGAFLGGVKTKMDAENYYIQIGNFKHIDELVKKLTEQG